MMLTDIQRLQAMGLDVWQLRHPAIYDQTHEVIQLPDTCQLLLVCDTPLSEKDAWLFGNILKSMKLSPEQTRQLPHAALSALGEHRLTWLLLFALLRAQLKDHCCGHQYSDHSSGDDKRKHTLMQCHCGPRQPMRAMAIKVTLGVAANLIPMNKSSIVSPLCRVRQKQSRPLGDLFHWLCLFQHRLMGVSRRSLAH